LGITAAGVATLRPLLKMISGGSSAPGHGTSARHWHKTGSTHPNGGYMRSDSGRDPVGDGFDLQDAPGKNIGVTTVINHGREEESRTQRQKGDDGSESSSYIANDWNNSQTDLAGRDADAAGWNIMVKKTVVQTRGDDQV
jgi:hypothetical protein